jgi:transposase InsO family protein
MISIHDLKSLSNGKLSIAFDSRCCEVNVRPSIESVGDCYDNATCKSFNATLECELLGKHRFRAIRKLNSRFDFIEAWYDLPDAIQPLTTARRRHLSRNGDLTFQFLFIHEPGNLT